MSALLPNTKKPNLLVIFFVNNIFATAHHFLFFSQKRTLLPAYHWDEKCGSADGRDTTLVHKRPKTGTLDFGHFFSPPSQASIIAA